MEQRDRKQELHLAGFAIALVAVSLAATWVGLSGTWVSDDWHMVNNYLYGDWAELGAVFRRNAAYYLFTEDQAGPYRPITMLTLLGTHLLAPAPWLHHLVSWLLHVATSLLLFAVLRQQIDSRNVGGPLVTSVAAGLAGLFFLHPAAVEAYVWINGRSDLVAGFWLVALVFALNLDRAPTSKPAVDVVLVAVITFLGAGSKLPFVLAAGAAWLAWALRTRSSRRVTYGIAIVVAIAAHAALRSAFAPFAGSLGSGDDVLLDSGVWATLPKLFAQAAVSLAFFRAEAMRSLSWVLLGPWTPIDVLAFVAVLLAGTWLLWKRDRPGVVYFGGALATLAPVVIVSRSFWMGFDRYLYMPSVLLLLAAGPHVLSTVQRMRRPIAASVVVALLLVASVQTHRASGTYASQSAHDQALLRDHPEDPSVHYYLARAANRSGDRSALR
ncbi:MAG: hypothetical protein WBG86_04420, partial [Polyangiales bacterium]